MEFTSRIQAALHSFILLWHPICGNLYLGFNLYSVSGFIPFLYRHLYILGDGALISQGSFMQTKHQCVLIYIWTKGEVGAVKSV